MTVVNKKLTVSHLPERKEINCLNCGTTVAGRYCQKCGQENIEPKESFWHLVVHFFNDFTHFDGKFFSTLKLLLLRPGFLTTEYVRGRRAAYLNPIRMFLFVSFIVFLVLFSIPSKRPSTSNIVAERDTLEHVEDTTAREQVTDSEADSSEKVLLATTRGIRISRNRALIDGKDSTYASYIARQESLPKHERDNFVRKWLIKKILAFTEYSRKYPDNIGEDILFRFKHSLSQMFFVSLPMFAFVLYLLYIRRRRAYYYVSHGIFSIHFYCAAYMIFLIFSLAGWAAGMVVHMQFIATIVVLIYLYIAMLKFYKQGWVKTILKYFVLGVFMSVFLLFLTLGFLINSLPKLPGGH